MKYETKHLSACSKYEHGTFEWVVLLLTNKKRRLRFVFGSFLILWLWLWMGPDWGESREEEEKNNPRQATSQIESVYQQYRRL